MITDTDWDRFVENTLNTKKGAEELRFHLHDLGMAFGIPASVKLSMEVLEAFFRNGNNQGVLILPEKEYLPFLIVVWKLIDDINVGRIESGYDPTKFIPGQKLKFGKCIVEFECIEYLKDQTRIRILLADRLSQSMPISLAPLFQKTETKKALSNGYKFDCERKQLSIIPDNTDYLHDIIKKIAANKTHIGSYCIYLTHKSKTNILIDSLVVEDAEFRDIFLVGNANSTGYVQIGESGQLTGTVPLVLTSDLYETIAVISKNEAIQAVYIDPSRIGIVFSQLNKLDELRDLGIKIILLASSSNAYDLDKVIDRGFWIWNWDQSTITSRLIDKEINVISRKFSNRMQQKIDWELLDDDGISICINNLYQIKPIVADSGYDNLSNLHDNLLSLALKYLGSIIAFSQQDIDQACDIIKKSLDLLNDIDRFIDAETCDLIRATAETLNRLYKNYPEPQKICRILDVSLTFRQHQTVCILVSDRMDLGKCRKYWTELIQNTPTNATVIVTNVSNYLTNDYNDYELIIVSGWLGREKIKDLLFSNNNAHYMVFLYQCENNWRTSSTKYWDKCDLKLRNSGIKSYILNGHFESPSSCGPQLTNEQVGEPEQINVDEYSEMDVYLKTRRYRRYSTDSNDGISVTINAVPISFVGNLFGLFTETHEMITVTDIIYNRRKELRLLTPDELRNGDFIAIRESSCDLIRELADTILANSKKAELRKISSEWRDALKIEIAFSGLDELIEKLRRAGCSRNKQTVRNWLHNTDTIMPSQKEDLIHIAEATSDDVMLERVDEIYEAGREVRGAHVQAGAFLSRQLIHQLANYMMQYGQIDPYNIDSPIVLNLEDIGKVRVLKIIDIGTPIEVFVSEVNHIKEDE